MALEKHFGLSHLRGLISRARAIAVARRQRVVAARSESSSSGAGEDKVLAYKTQCAKESELRETVEQLLESEGRKFSVQFKEGSEEINCEEEETLEVDGDAGSEKKLDQRQRENVKQLRKG